MTGDSRRGASTTPTTTALLETKESRVSDCNPHERFTAANRYALVGRLLNEAFLRKFDSRRRLRLRVEPERDLHFLVRRAVIATAAHELKNPLVHGGNV